MNVLVLGGGIGGVVAANVLSRKLGREHEIVLVDRRTKHRFSPSYPWLMMGWREPHQITRNLNLLNKKGIKYINGEVLKIDPANRFVKTSTKDFVYDYLIVALGAELAPETIPGFSDKAYHIYELEEAMKFREVLRNFSGGAVAVVCQAFPSSAQQRLMKPLSSWTTTSEETEYETKLTCIFSRQKVGPWG